MACQGAAVILLLTTLAAHMALCAGNGPSLHINLCFGLTILKQDPDGLKLNRPFAVPEAAAVLRAIKDINDLDCSILGAGCERLLALPGGKFTELQEFVMDMRTFAQVAGPVAVFNCEELGGHAVIGLHSSIMNDAAALLAHSFRTPVMSYSAVSPHLSEQNLYKFFARTCFSTEVVARNMVHLYKRFGWKRVASIYENDIQGFDYNEVFTGYAREAGLTVLSHGVLPAATLAFPVNEFYNSSDPEGERVREDWRRAVKFLIDNDIKVVHTSFNYARFAFFTNLALDEGLDLSKLHWSGAELPALEDFAANLNNPAAPVLNNQSSNYPGALHGVISLQHGLNRDQLLLEHELAHHLNGWFSIDKLSSILLDPDGLPDPTMPGNVESTFYSFIGNNRTTWGALKAYDSVWAMAAAFTRAALREAEDRPLGAGQDFPVPSGDSVMAALREVEFAGASGELAFDSSADRLQVINHKMEITNLLWDEATRKYTAQVVGVITQRDDGGSTIELFEGENALVWPDNTKYPQIFSDGSIQDGDGSEPSTPVVVFHWHTVLAISLGAIVLFAVTLAGCLWWQRAKWLHGYGMKRRWGPPLRGDPITFAITDIHGSTTLWDKCPEEKAMDIVRHHQAARARLKEFHGYEVATEGDSFICAFHTPEDAVLWSVSLQLDLLCAPWTSTLEDGGAEHLQCRSDWADCNKPAVLDSEYQQVLHELTTRDALDETRDAIAHGAVTRPIFNAQAAANTEFSKKWAKSHGVSLCCFHSSSPDPLPVFRGLRVRIGIHSGIVTKASRHENTRRVIYKGDIMTVAKAVAEAPCGGQIIASGETIAQVRSMPALSAMVATMCAGWRSGLTEDDPNAPAGLSVMHLGSHLIMDPDIALDALEDLPDPSDSDRSLGGPWILRALRANKENRVEPTAPAKSKSAFTPVSSRSDEGFSSHGQMFNHSTSGTEMHGLRNATHDPVLQQLAEVTPGGDRRALLPSDNLALDIEALSGLWVSDEPEGMESHFSVYDALAEESKKFQPEDGIAEEGETLAGSKELVMIAPWALIQRVMYFPPPTSLRQLTPPWHAAPKAAGVTILFTAVEKFDKLSHWEQEEGSNALQRAVQMLQQVVRTQLKASNGYEVEGEGVRFVCAFHTPADAINFCAAVQISLLAAEWDREILSSPWGCEYRAANGYLTFRGLRLGMGMCTGNAMRVQPSDRTGRIEYFGPIMNHAARVAMCARGGQILMHESTWRHATNSPGRMSSDLLFRNMGKHVLKGITSQVYIIQAIPKVLAARDFGPINVRALNVKQGRNKASGSDRGEDQQAHMIEEYLGRLKADRDRHTRKTAPGDMVEKANSMDAGRLNEKPMRWAE